MSGVAWFQLILLALIWGGSFLSTRIALDEIGPLTAVMHRCLWAMLVLWIVVLATGQRPPASPRLWLMFLIMGVLNNVLPFFFLAWGQLHIESGLTAIFNSFTAVFGVVIAAIVFADERLTARKGIGVVFGVLGVATAMGMGTLGEIDLRSLAQLSVLCATLCYALGGSFGRAKLSHLPPLIAAAGMLTGSTLVMIPLAWAVEGTPSFDLAARTWGAIAYYSLIATGVAYLLYYSILAKAGSGNLMLVTLLLVPVAILLGHLVLGEVFLTRHLAGFGIIAVGLVVLDGRVVRMLRGRPIDV
ncbi:transmembrane drug/metabolite transporter family protein [Pseudooceanicola batsensis HTCC2597]|uniref:Transmembrane drug/metabolite transporter family protein n=2 Tax=Pseudooceanicola batsensis TaxID=314255 RepID=A3TWX8_PSEBH|nr:transmembrane drug/metabolite transporter family protein [Pseudooceanicola batsensis HTCC2597]